MTPRIIPAGEAFRGESRNHLDGGTINQTETIQMTKKVVNAEVGTVTWTFDDGTSETFDIAKTRAEIQARLALHGASQKIGDSYAGAGDEADPLAYAKEAVKDTIAQLYAGDWRVSAGAGGPRVSDLAAAMARASGKTVEEMVALLADKTDEQKKLTRKIPAVAAALAAIGAEKMAAKAAKLAAAAAGSEALTF